MPTAPKPRPIWENRFSRPTAEALLAEIPKPQGQYATVFRDTLLPLEGVSEELTWHGIPWRWSFIYRSESQTLAYLVPAPVKPLVCLPILPAAFSAIPAKKVSKVLREAVTNAPLVGGVHWAQWELASKAQCDETLALLQLLRDAAAAAS